MLDDIGPRDSEDHKDAQATCNALLWLLSRAVGRDPGTMLRLLGFMAECVMKEWLPEDERDFAAEAFLKMLAQHMGYTLEDK